MLVDTRAETYKKGLFMVCLTNEKNKMLKNHPSSRVNSFAVMRNHICCETTFSYLFYSSKIKKSSNDPIDDYTQKSDERYCNFHDSLDQFMGNFFLHGFPQKQSEEIG